MRRAITSCFLAGTLVIGGGPAFGDEPASGMSRWFRNPFAKAAPTKDAPAKSASTATPTGPEVRREPAKAVPTAKSAQPISAPKRLQAPPVRSAEEHEAAPTPAASTRRSAPSAAAEVESPRASGLVRRKPSSRAVRGSLLDDEPVASSAAIETNDQAAVRAESLDESPTAPPRRRFMPLGRGPQPSRTAAPETAGEAFEPTVDPRLPAPPPDIEAAAEALGIDRVPDPARTSPDEAAPVRAPLVNFEEVAEAVADEEPTPPTSVPMVEAEDAPTRPADKAARPSLLPWRPSFFGKPTAPKTETPAVETEPVAAEEAPRTPARSSKSGRRPSPARPNAAQPELQLDAGELEEVQVIGDQPPAESEPARAPKPTPRPRTVEVEQPSERPATAAAERPSLSQRFKGWWGVKK
ncbi:MAG: hypothetical protein U0939_08075 [Pirellulales bacterium]